MTEEEKRDGIITNEIKCPNCEYPMSMGQACPKCGLEDRSMVEKSIHDRDTEPITKVVLICEADGCATELLAPPNPIITIKGQKYKLCTSCEQAHYAHLDQQNGIVEEVIGGGE